MIYTIQGESGVVSFEKQENGSLNGVITSESLSLGNKATSNALESGYDINDHAVNEPVKFDLSGIIVNGEDGREALEKLWKNRDLVEYQGIERLDNLLITKCNISRKADNKKGFSFTISFQRMNIVSAEIVKVDAPKMSQEKAKVDASILGTETRKTSNYGMKTTGTDTVSASGYLDNINKIVDKKINTDITQSRTNPSTPGYGV